MTRALIVRRSDGYAGVDRPRIGSFTDVPAALVERAIALEDMGLDGVVGLKELLGQLRARQVDAYELIAVGSPSPPADWQLLGHDVAETTPAAWSAIAHHDVFMDTGTWASEWAPLLNEHGLFARLADAERLLAVYLASDDPDRGWTRAGWQDDPGIYAVLPVWRSPD